MNKRNAENNQKSKNRLFFGHEYALTYDDCAPAKNMPDVGID